MKKLLWLTLLLCPSLSAQRLSGEVGSYSRYVWRGAALTSVPVVQPEVVLTRGTFSVGLWNNFTAQARTETDLWAEVGTDAVSVGWITYDFTVQEVYGSLTLGVGRLYVAQDLAGAGTYVQPGLAVTIRHIEFVAAYGFGQVLDHIEFTASRTWTQGVLSLTPSLAVRSGLLWGGVSLAWGNE